MSQIKLHTNIQRTPKVMQIEGMFDITPEQTSTTTIQDNIPDLTQRDWNIGLIVGASGTGKSTIAKQHFGELLNTNLEWDNTKALIDSFPQQMSIKQITTLLSSVGFSSPPSWLRPYNTLSNGEQFRVTMARMLAENPDLVAIDEYTSVVDRNVAKIGSTALAKTIRKQNTQFVAVSCHYDIIEWLQPDWMYEPATGVFTWECLRQRPPINIEIIKTNTTAWKLFAPHHYLDHAINPSAQMYLALVDKQPAAICAVLTMVHPKVQNARRISRIVTLPDYQGVGIGNTLLDTIAGAYKANNQKMYIATSHPAMIHALNKNKQWAMNRKPSRVNPPGKNNTQKAASGSRVTASFTYAGQPNYEAMKLVEQ